MREQLADGPRRGKEVQAAAYLADILERSLIAAGLADVDADHPPLAANEASGLERVVTQTASEIEAFFSAG